MTDKRDVPMGDLQDLELDAPRGAARPAAPTPPLNASTAPKPERSKPAVTATTATAARRSNPWPWLLVLLLALVLVAGGYVVYQELSHVRSQLHAQQNESSDRLGDLATQLSAADQSRVQSAEQMQQLLATHGDEIRKLWDLANKRNRADIEASQKAIAALEQNNKEQATALTALRTELASARTAASEARTAATDARKIADEAQKQAAAAQTALQQTTVARNQLQTQLDLANETLGQLEQRLGTQQRTLDDLRKILPALQAVAATQSQRGGVGSRLNELEDAVNAFDSYRVQVNNRLDALQGR